MQLVRKSECFEVGIGVKQTASAKNHQTSVGAAIEGWRLPSLAIFHTGTSQIKRPSTVMQEDWRQGNCNGPFINYIATLPDHF